jgi:iron complex outermembrane receptor protein
MNRSKTSGLFLSILSLNLSLSSFISFDSSEIFAEGTDKSAIKEATQQAETEIVSRNRENVHETTDAVIAEEIATEALWFGFYEEVTIATRHETPVSKAPSIVTVITAEEIKNLGYRTFAEILRTVPGFEIAQGGTSGSVLPNVRGLDFAGQIRLMLNGHLVNNPFRGDAFTNFDNFPVENIKRIEIIRGPGSAVYGENAFSAVINIITFDAKDINGCKVSSGYGSFDTYEENVVFGESYGKVDISGMVHYKQTTGFDGIVESDSQTITDKNLSPFGFSAASEAPGPVQNWGQEYDLNLKMAYKDFYVEGFYQNKNRGPFIGIQNALNDESDVETNYVFVEAGYKKILNEKFTLKPRVYYDQFDNNFFFESLPEGATIPNTSGVLKTYPDGLVGNGAVIEKVVGTEIPFDYEVFDGNVITLGLEYRLINQTSVRYSSNFHPVTLDPLEGMQDFSDTYPFIKEATRRIESVYLQDMWDITNTINLTLGIRYDHYSDFGGTLSPRAGLTWAFTKNASLKLLYGEAFRAPSFQEMYTTNQPAVEGNPDLDPETIRTYEAGLSYKFNKYVTSSINYFYNDVKDLIGLRVIDIERNTRRFENEKSARVQGIEMETKVHIMKDNYVFMNYTFQNPEDNHGDDLPFVAQHTGNFGINVHYWKYINTNLSTFVSGRRSRDRTDERETRDDLPAYALLNLSIIGKEFFKTMEVQGTVFNLLDKDYSDPGGVSIPEDLPRPGRTFFVGLSYQF